MWVASFFVTLLIALQMAGWRAMARKDFRRLGGAGLSALHEIVEPHTAEHQRVEQHAADVLEDENGDGDRRRPPGLVSS